MLNGKLIDLFNTFNNLIMAKDEAKLKEYYNSLKDETLKSFMTLDRAIEIFHEVCNNTNYIQMSPDDKINYLSDLILA